MIYPCYLVLYTDYIALKARQTITIDARLTVYKIDKATQDFQFSSSICSLFILSFPSGPVRTRTSRHGWRSKKI